MPNTKKNLKFHIKTYHFKVWNLNTRDKREYSEKGSISYTLRKAQEPNDNKDWKAIQFFYQEIVHKRDKGLWKTLVDFLILAYHWEMKMTGLWISAEICLLRYSLFSDRLSIFHSTALQALTYRLSVWEILNIWSQSTDGRNT